MEENVSNQKIKLGIIGAGANTQKKHIPEFQKIKDVEIIGVANRSIESSQKVAKEFNIPTAYNNWQELLASPDIDAVCIGTWPYMHEILVTEALNEGKHVLTEARMSMDTSQARNMLDASYLKPELVAQIVPAPFIDTVEKTVLDLINDDYIGDILAADLSGIPGFMANSAGGGFIDYNAPFMWRHDRDLSGYNIMLMGAWYECIMRLLGPAINATAITRVYNKQRLTSDNNKKITTIPDHVEILSEMSSGALTHIRISEITGFASEEQLWIYGSKGTLLCTGFENYTSGKLFGGQKGDKALKEIPISDDKKGFWRVEQEFVNAIKGIEKVSHTTFEDGVKYMEFTEAVTRSSQNRQTVALPL